MNATHPLSHLRGDKVQLVASIDAALAALDIASGLLVEARNAATAARDIASGLLVEVRNVADEIAEALASDAPPTPQMHAQVPPQGSEPVPEGEERPSREPVPSWMRGGIVGALFGPNDDAPALPPVPEGEAGRLHGSRAARSPADAVPHERQGEGAGQAESLTGDGRRGRRDPAS